MQAPAPPAASSRGPAPLGTTPLCLCCGETIQPPGGAGAELELELEPLKETTSHSVQAAKCENPQAVVLELPGFKFSTRTTGLKLSSILLCVCVCVFPLGEAEGQRLQHLRKKERRSVICKIRTQLHNDYDAEIMNWQSREKYPPLPSLVYIQNGNTTFVLLLMFLFSASGNRPIRTARRPDPRQTAEISVFSFQILPVVFF